MKTFAPENQLQKAKNKSYPLSHLAIPKGFRVRQRNITNLTEVHYMADHGRRPSFRGWLQYRKSKLEYMEKAKWESVKEGGRGGKRRLNLA